MSAGSVRNRRGRRAGRGVWPLNLTWRSFLRLYYPTILTVAISCLVSCSIITAVENRLRPVLLTVAQVQTKNTVTAVAEQAIVSELERRQFSYSDMVSVERSEDGSITAITTDMAAMNLLRSAMLEVLLDHVSQIDEEAISIPIGSLIDSELVWGRGPSIKVRAFTIGTVSVEFRSEFLSAGVNQTLHKIWLDLSVPATILLPGTQLETCVDTALCVAETVIVGKVPSYVQRAVG